MSWLRALQAQWLPEGRVSLVREQRWRIAALAVATVLIVAGKQFYRDATPADLRFILAPTAQLVSWLSGHDFVYESGQGWMNTEIMFVIAPACAGVHFALAAFLVVVLGMLPGMTTARATAKRLALAATLAYTATLVVNTTRIVIAVHVHRADLHRLEGTLVYLVGLCAVYTLARAIEARRWRVSVGSPVIVYLVITLGMPLLNGAAQRDGFATHAAWVLAVSAAVVACGVLVQQSSTGGSREVADSDLARRPRRHRTR